MSSGVMWVVVAVVVIAIVVGIVVWRSRTRRLEGQRAEAAQLRDSTAQHHLDRREQEAAASSAEAEARRVRAEADQHAAEAKRLEVEADRRRIERDAAQEESAAQLRRADALDPDVPTDSDGRRLAEDGKPVEEERDPSTRPTVGEHDESDLMAPQGSNERTRDDNLPGADDDALAAHQVSTAPPRRSLDGETGDRPAHRETAGDGRTG